VEAVPVHWHRDVTRYAHIGPSNAFPRAAPETTPLWRLLSLSLSRQQCAKIIAASEKLNFPQAGREADAAVPVTHCVPFSKRFTHLFGVIRRGKPG
jgi:hypothetical protein